MERAHDGVLVGHETKGVRVSVPIRIDAGYISGGSACGGKKYEDLSKVKEVTKNELEGQANDSNTRQ